MRWVPAVKSGMSSRISVGACLLKAEKPCNRIKNVISCRTCRHASLYLTPSNPVWWCGKSFGLTYIHILGCLSRIQCCFSVTATVVNIILQLAYWAYKRIVSPFYITDDRYRHASNKSPSLEISHKFQSKSYRELPRIRW